MRYLRLWALIAFLAAAAGCAPVDRRSSETSFEDENIESQAISRINSLHLENIHVNATSFDRHVLLTGEVPSEDVGAKIAQVVSGTPNIQGVSNELVVGETRGIASQTSDSLITSDVKLRFARSSLGVGRVKVVTESGTVFLMGLVYRKEGRAAADLASTTKGVERVILLFEYLD
jgi:osmotically-inducible protein OsmY